ncbi:hypothetical protein L218DRAFT_1033965 [Marasmius fiardii PR-910]|nr:hypothetical protein L218DRAFT_1033965 [Marasmius fiardii PR-910]
MADLHSVTFEWPYGSANNVILTGTFDHWSKSIRLDKQNASFKGTVKVPWNQKVAYKFIVDGEWRVNDREPTEKDPAGNLNNVYVAPEKLVELSKPESTIQREPVLEKVEDIPAEKALSSDGGKVVAPAVLSDLVQTVVAAEGTASAVDYVVSSVGAAIQGVLGVDPINANKVSLHLLMIAYDTFLTALGSYRYKLPAWSFLKLPLSTLQRRPVMSMLKGSLTSP